MNTFLDRPGQNALAYVASSAKNSGKNLPVVLFMGGYRSDMNGTKATALEKFCRARGQAYVRFDYSGHGQSQGKFEEGTMGLWRDDALAIFDHVLPLVHAQHPVVLVGSSMGGWIALLVALVRPQKIKGLIGIAAAPDFTEELYERLSAAQKEEFHARCFADIANDYSDTPYHFTKSFYEEAKAHLLLRNTHRVDFSVRLVQGKQDKDVHWRTAEKIRAAFSESDVQCLYVEDGDHSLSRPQDLDGIDAQIRALSGACT